MSHGWRGLPHKLGSPVSLSQSTSACTCRHRRISEMQISPGPSPGRSVQRTLSTATVNDGRSSRQFFSKSFLQIVFAIILSLTLNPSSQVFGYPAHISDADHITAMAGDYVVFNCEVNFPNDQVVPYVVQWWRKDRELPIYIWYDDYPTHSAKEYTGRVSRAERRSNSSYGLASLNLTNIKNEDRGWYNCKVLFLDRSPEVSSNGTWYHLDVHSKPYFIQKPDDIVYVSLADSIILTCQAAGIPQPLIHWFKGRNEVVPSYHIGIFNDGTELRIANVRSSDLGTYSCVAKNAEGNITQYTKLVQAGGAVILNPPIDQTVLERSEVIFHCEGQANPSNLTVNWYKDNIPVKSIDEGALSERALIRSDGALVISTVVSSDKGSYTCEVTNGIGQPVTASANLVVHYPARVYFTETVQYLPKGLQGIINCHIEADPPIDFVTWTKNKKLFDPFEKPGIMALKNGSLLIDKVTSEHAGEYTCTPFNREGSDRSSGIIQVIIKDPPEFIKRPELEYIKDVGGRVNMPCRAVGTPTPTVVWRRIDGLPLPRQRATQHNGELTIDNLRQNDHGVYECVVTNDVATIVVRTALLVEMTTPHAPRNVTVTNSETFAVTIEWLPGYSGCTDCQQTYKIRYREKDSKFPNWIELPVNPPNARQIEIHNLIPNTKYEFQVMGINQFGDGMFSEIIEASTKGDGGLDFSVYPPPTASPSEQSTSSECSKKKSLESPLLRKLLSSGECIEFNVEIRPPQPGTHSKTAAAHTSDKQGDVPPGEQPPAATNLTLTQEAGGYVLRWQGPDDPSKVMYYTIEIKKDGQGEKWRPLTDHKIDTEEASYMMKNMGTAKAYWFRVFSHSATSYSISEKFKYDLPENVKRRAVTAGLIGGILFFIVAIILSVCTVKICNKKRRKKHERAYDYFYPDSFSRTGESRDSSLIPQPYTPYPHPTSLRRGLLSLFDTVAICVQTLHDKMIDEHHYQANLKTHHYDPNQSYGSDFFDYSDGRRRQTKFKKSAGKTFKIRSDVPTQPGHGPRTKRGFISRTKEGKFVLEDDSDEGEGGFELELPPNRFRTRSVAIVAGYSPERLYSNMPPGAFVVESGVYKVGADRAHEKHEPIYWKQVVYGARGGSDGSGTIPRRVGKLVEEDLQRLRALEPQSSLVVSSPQWGGAENLEVRTNNPPRLHASSPLYQGAPLIEWTSPINNYSDLSSVPHNSVERSIPSTLLTSPNFSSNIENSSSSRSQLQQHRSQRSNESQLLQHRSQRSLKTIHEEEPRSSVSIVQAEVYPHAPNQPPRDGRPSGLFMNQRDQDLYWQRTTYQNAESMFPNYALNYPAPIHGNLSPSLQYPPQLLPRFGFEEIGIFPHPSYYQNPLATSSPPVSRSQRVGHDPGYVDMSRTISVPPIAPRAIVTSPGYHDYENTRYCSHKPGEAPPLYVAPPQPQYPGVRAHQRNRKTAVIDGAVRRIRAAQVTEASRQIQGARGDAVSLVSEVLDAEVTALTSSPGSTTSRSSGQKPPADPTEETLLTETTSSSGIMSKNSSSQNRTTSSSSTGQQQIQSSEQSSPFYENWPMQHRSSGSGLHVMPASDSEPLPPLLPHGNQLQPEYQDPDTSLETPPGAVGGASGGLSRPSSSHSAPFLDLSIDRHYEFDSARTPTDDLVVQQAALDLPRTWARPYLGYNPRTRDRELGPAAELAKKERVFSDSEIYSPVFPRGRPDPTIDISARVQAMKKEFAEYRSQKLREQQKIVESKPVDPLEEPPKPPVSPTMLITHLPLSIRTASTEELEVNPSERLESII